MKRLYSSLRLSRDRIALVSTLVFLFSVGWSAVGYAQVTAYPVTVFKNGSGSGMVTSVGLSPDEIACGLVCSGFGPEDEIRHTDGRSGRRFDLHRLGRARL